LGDSWCLARALHYSGELARSQGDYEHARTFYEESLTHYHAMNFRHTAAIVFHNLGYVAQHQGDPKLALSHFAQALFRQVEQHDRLNIAHCLGGVAGMAVSLGRPTEAARLFGAAETLLATMDAEVWPVDKLDFDRNRDDVRFRLGENDFAAAYSAGQVMPLEAAIAEADALIADLNPSSRAGKSSSTLTPAIGAAFGLTPREGEILRLLSRRATNREIADTLSISPRTVMRHVSHILTKIGVANRRDAAAWAARRGIA
jgi:serine/threonine-protein kinase PknK